MRSLGLVDAALVTLSGAAGAAPILDFSGLEVTVSVSTTSDGGQGFVAVRNGADTATIGAGPEFTLSLGANGFPTRNLNLDFTASGLVDLYADSQFAIGNTGFDDFGFEVAFSIAGATFDSAVANGRPVRGSASASGLDPVVWSFVNERDNAFGQLLTFAGQGPDTPTVQLAAQMPEPGVAALLALGIAGVAGRRPSLGRRRAR